MLCFSLRRRPAGESDTISGHPALTSNGSGPVTRVGLMGPAAHRPDADRGAEAGMSASIFARWPGRPSI